MACFACSGCLKLISFLNDFPLSFFGSFRFGKARGAGELFIQPRSALLARERERAGMVDGPLGWVGLRRRSAGVGNGPVAKRPGEFGI
jgi:hypothetical protein